MAKQDDLLALETGFWNGDADFYRENLADPCLVVFTEMAGVFSKEKIAATVKKGSRWQNVEFDAKGLIEPSSKVAILSYKARATRKNGESYAALVSSCYVDEGGTWKLAFHQQTPLDK